MQSALLLDRIEESYIRDILAAASEPGVTSLAGGLPSPEHFPMRLMRAALTQLAGQPQLFQYGSSRGHAPLLECLRQRWQLTPATDLLVCNGSQQALDLIARAFLDPGDQVVMEAPCYVGALQVFSLAGAQIELVPQNSEGPDLTVLETLFARGNAKLFYAVPDFHNPTGLCWSLAARCQVALLCERYGVSLVEDAPYRELRFAGDELPLVSSWCPQRALVLRSFSKISAPGMRLGAVSGPTHWIQRLLTVKQVADLHTNVPLQEVMRCLLLHPEFEAHLQQLRYSYRERYQVLSGVLRQAGAAVGGFNTVQGGMFLWLELAAGTPLELAQESLARGVAVVPGTAFYPAGYPAPPAMRLNFSNATAVALGRAAEILCELITAR